MGENSAKIRKDIENTRGEMSKTVDALAYKTDVKARVQDNLRDKTNAVRSKVGQVVSGAAASTPGGDDIAGQARQGMRLAQENPLGLAIGAAAIGFLIGTLVPSTQIEDEKIGPLADTIKDQALESGKEAMNRGQQVAQDVVQSATKTAQESGQRHAQEFSQSTAANARETAATLQHKGSPIQ
jgi:ElaB/YqjD/DUF883 family membrane-anchored ribosome-binding protein